MVTATKGFTFNDTGGGGNTCSSANLHTLVDSATFSGLEIADFLDSEKPVFLSGTAPVSPPNGQPWFIAQADGSSTNPIGMLLIWNGEKWIPIAEGVTYTNNGTVDVQYGDVVKITPASSTEGNGTFSEALVGINGVVFGVVGQSIVTNASGFIITRGFCKIRTITGTPVNWGVLVPNGGLGVVSAQAGSTLVTQNGFGRLLDKTNNLAYVCAMMKITT